VYHFSPPYPSASHRAQRGVNATYCFSSKLDTHSGSEAGPSPAVGPHALPGALLLPLGVKAHVLVAFLGYALPVTLKHLLKAECFGAFTGPGAEATLRTVQRRHRATDGRRAGDLVAEDFQAGAGSRKITPATPRGIAETLSRCSSPNEVTFGADSHPEM
jgi:hypothetical protein